MAVSAYGKARGGRDSRRERRRVWRKEKIRSGLETAGRTFWRVSPVLMLLLFACLAWTSASVKTSVYDEHPHITAGRSILLTGRFSDTLDNPPLGQLLIASVARLVREPYVPFRDEGLMRFRIAPIAVGVLLGAVLFLWIRAMYDGTVARFVLFLYVFSPTCLGYTRFAVLDFMSAAFFIFHLWALWWLLNELEAGSSRRWAALAAAGVSLGAAVCIKYTALILVPASLMILMFLPGGARKTEGGSWRRRLRAWGWRFFLERSVAWLLLMCVAVLTVDACYLFRGIGMVKRIPPDVARTLSLEQIRVLKVMAPVMPGEFVTGLAGKFRQAVQGGSNYLMGEQSGLGWWWYFFACFAFKTPFLLQLLLAAWLWGWIRGRISWSDAHFVFFGVPMLLFLYLSFFSRINIGFRHVAAIVPAAHMLCADVCEWWRGLKSPLHWRISGVVCFLAAYASGTLLMHPHYMEFFNRVWCGGPSNGYRYLVDANLDWGQDDHLPQRWARQHGLPGIVTNRYPWSPRTGWFALSANCRVGLGFDPKLEPWRWLKKFEPEARLAYTWFVYHVEKEDFERWCREHPSDDRGWVDLAEIRLRSGDIDGAYDALRKVEDSRIPQVVFRRHLVFGKMALAAADYDTAARELKAALSMRPESVEARSYLDVVKGRILLRKVGEPPVREGLASALPRKEALVILQGYLMMVRAYGLLGEFSVARKFLKGLKEAGFDRFSDYWFHAAYYWFHRAEFGEAYRCMKKAHELSPDNKAVEAALSEMWMWYARSISPVALDAVECGRKMREMGQYYSAMNMFYRAHLLDPACADPLWHMGSLQISRRLGATPFSWR